MRRLPAFILLLLSALVGAEGVYINDAGTLRQIQTIWINDAGTLRQIQTAWINDAGTLRQFYQASVVSLSGEIGIDALGLSPQIAGIRVNTDGTIDKNINGGYTQIDSGTDWIIPNGAASSDYDVMWNNSGSSLAAGSDLTVTWLPMSANREWFVEANSETLTFDGTLSIRYNGGSPLDSAAYTGSAETTD